jgi:hypothetical protein
VEAGRSRGGDAIGEQTRLVVAALEPTRGVQRDGNENIATSRLAFVGRAGIALGAGIALRAGIALGAGGDEPRSGRGAHMQQGAQMRRESRASTVLEGEHEFAQQRIVVIAHAVRALDADALAAWALALAPAGAAERAGRQRRRQEGGAQSAARIGVEMQAMPVATQAIGEARRAAHEASMAEQAFDPSRLVAFVDSMARMAHCAAKDAALDGVRR